MMLPDFTRWVAVGVTILVPLLWFVLRLWWVRRHNIPTTSEQIVSQFKTAVMWSVTAVVVVLAVLLIA